MAHEPITPGRVFSGLLEENGPQAAAWIRGGTGAPYLSGLVKFYETFYGGVLIEAELFGLPDEETAGSAGFYAMHIHTSGSCAGPCGVCSQAGRHYAPTCAAHPGHAGCLLPLLSCQGYAWLAFYDKRLTLPEIIGSSVVIRPLRGDPASRSSGDSKAPIGCGVIRMDNGEEMPENYQIS